jgi:hypothetical protein
LANQYGSDKGTLGPEPQWPVHNYTDVYEAYLGHLRDQPVNLLEIGLGVDGANWRAYIATGRNEGGGGSMKMWRDYFHRGTIFGIDINPASFLDGDRVRTFVVDQGDPESLKRFQQEIGDVAFDVIIDDGSHRPDHQQVSLGMMFPALKPGGVYFIEDLMSNGAGDPDRGRYSAADVLNTRNLLKALRDQGSLPAPHKIPNPDALVSTAASIAFHCPVTKATRPGRFLSRIFGQPIVSYRDGFETLCAIRKG